MLTFFVPKGGQVVTIDIQSLISIGMTPEEAENIINYNNMEDIIRKLRIFRSHILDEIHSGQQALDKIDYIIARIKKENT